MTEEGRATLHREQRTARCQAKCERLEALAGDSAARLELALAWHPLYLAMQERFNVDLDLDCLCSVEPFDPDLILAN